MAAELKIHDSYFGRRYYVVCDKCNTRSVDTPVYMTAMTEAEKHVCPVTQTEVPTSSS